MPGVTYFFIHNKTFKSEIQTAPRFYYVQKTDTSVSVVLSFPDTAMRLYHLLCQSTDHTENCDKQ